MAGRLAGRRVLLTGAGAGIGLETARLCRAEGAAVAILDRRPGALEKARELLAKVGGAVSLEADVTDPEAVGRAVAEAASALGGLDGLVNCAAIDMIRPLAETEPEEWERLMRVNLTGPMLVCRAAIPALKAAGGGAAVVNIASAAGLLPLRHRTAYCSSKAALIMFGKCLAMELAEAGVRVNSVCPGAVDTELFRSVLRPEREAAELEDVRARYLLRRLGTTGEIASAILFLLSEEAAYVTGTSLAVDGGRSFH